MATSKTSNDDVGYRHRPIFRPRQRERAYQSIIGRGYTKDEINLAMADETRKVLFPGKRPRYRPRRKSGEEGVDLGNPKGGTLATVTTAVSAIGACRSAASPARGWRRVRRSRGRRAGRSGRGRSRGRSHRRASALGHSCIADGRISRGHREGRRADGRQAPFAGGCALLRAAMVAEPREPRSTPERRMLLCPETLEPCGRPGCTRAWCERTEEALLVLCWECGSVTSRHGTITVCVECARGPSPQPDNGH
jgi:hypothetical protein